MSSMRNAAPRRPHRERSQPTARAKWGLLEKHKDYSLRAADYNKKKAKLNILSEKAKTKHPDEFAFSMINNAQGKHGQRGTENRLSVDAVKLLKTQDAGYLRTVAGRTRRELAKAEEEVGLAKVMQGKTRQKITFDEEDEVAKRRKGNDDDEMVDETREDEESEQVAVAPVKSKQAQLKEIQSLARLKADRKRRKRLQELRANKLNVLKKRQHDILAAAEQLELQRAKMAGTVGGVNKNGVKFKVRQRQK